jgi:hypothetical protein
MFWFKRKTATEKAAEITAEIDAINDIMNQASSMPLYLVDRLISLKKKLAILESRINTN